MLAPLPLFIWSKQRIVPVRLAELSIIEEAFDPNLNPIRAKVSLSMRVLSVDDLGFDHKGGSLHMAYMENKERLARLNGAGTLGVGGSGSVTTSGLSTLDDDDEDPLSDASLDTSLDADREGFGSGGSQGGSQGGSIP